MKLWRTWLVAGLVAAVMSVAVGCGAEEAAEEELAVVPDGKADNFFSLSAQEYMVEGTYYVELESGFATSDEESRMHRVKELIYYKQIAVNWFLLQFLMGPEDDHDNKYKSLTKNGSYEDLEVTQDPENSLRFTFKFRQEVGGEMDLLENLPVTIGADGRHRFDLPVGKVSNTALAQLDLDNEWYRKSPWSKFNPASAGADKVETLELAIWPEERSADGWVDYNRLMEDGELTISVHFGWDYHKEYHLVHSKDVYNWLVNSQKFASPASSYEQYNRKSGPLTRAITANGRQVQVKVWLYWGQPGSESDPDTDAGGMILEQDMIAAFKTNDVIMFSGHSGPFYAFALANWRKTSKGDIDDSEIMDLEMPADRYQVVVAEGCDTYAVGQAFWANPAKSDRTNLDIITTTNFSNASTAGVVRNSLLALFEVNNGQHNPWKYSEWLRRLDSNSTWFQSMYGVHGIDDNPRLHPYAAVKTFCSQCTSDSQCGSTGNRCVRINDDEKVCTAECLANEGCPAGYECREAASGSWIVSRYCFPTNLTCMVAPKPEVLSAVIINEVLADPGPGLTGDANGDGVRDGSHDEFVELISLSAAPVDLAGWMVADGFGTRYVIPAGTTLLPGRALVIFGGGSASTVADLLQETGSQLLLANGLGLNNDGDTVSLLRPDGSLADRLEYGTEAGADRSLVRAVDGDATSAFVPHPGDSLFSPGRKSDGTTF